MRSLSFVFLLSLDSLFSATLFPIPSEKPKTAEFSEATYKIEVDISMSPYAGGEVLLFGQRALERTFGWAMGSNPVVYSSRNGARMWRLCEEFLLWLPANYFEVVLQHEVYGHGYRLRDLNRVDQAEVLGYDFGIPIPYGSGGGATFFEISENYTTTEGSMTASAGVESTAILANLTKWKWIEANRIDPRQVFLYLFSQYDLPLYVGSIDGAEEIDGHDMKIYAEMVNYTYPEKLLDSSLLKALSWINLADPFTYYAIYALFHYISSGEQAPIPMIGRCYLPGLRLGLTPFGPEIFLENYFRYKMPLYGYIKAGQHSENSYYGLGFYGTDLWNYTIFHLGLRADVWYQPQLLLDPGSIPFSEINFKETPNPLFPLYPFSQQKQMKWGGAFSLIGKIKQSSLLGYEIELGGKSEGFLPGYSLRSSLTLRVSTNLLF